MKTLGTTQLKKEQVANRNGENVPDARQRT